MNDKTHTILIVDDHPMMRDGLATQIMNEQDLAVCGEADDVEPALELVRTLKPDMAIIDIRLKTGNGIDLVRSVRERYPQTKTLVNSVYEEATFAAQAFRAGASGYLCKQTARATLIAAIRTVLAGETYLSPDTSEHRERASPEIAKPGWHRIDRLPIDRLSDCELEVFRLIGRGHETRVIAELLQLSLYALEANREKLKTKLNIADNASLVRYAVQWTLASGGAGPPSA